MSNPGLVNEAFRHLQAGQAQLALQAARAVATAHPTLARARLAEAIALRMLGRMAEASAALKRAAALDPRDHGVAYEAGVVHQMQGDRDAALAEFERARILKPAFFAAHFSAGSLCLDAKDWNGAAERFRAALAVQPAQIDALTHLARALKGADRPDEADAAYVHALAANPHDPKLARAFGQYSVARGNYKRAATLFMDAWRGLPDDENLPIFLAQVELMLGHWDAAWAAYSKRAPRKHMERTLAALGAKYPLYSFASLKGRDVSLVAEQGLGDIFFFLRWAPLAARAGARLHFIGPPQLHSMLGRTGLFASFHAFGDASAPAALPLMIGDLPQIAGGDPFAQPGLLDRAATRSPGGVARTARSRGPATMDRRHLARGHTPRRTHARPLQDRADSPPSSKRFARSAARWWRCSASPRRASSRQPRRCSAARCTTSPG